MCKRNFTKEADMLDIIYNNVSKYIEELEAKEEATENDNEWIKIGGELHGLYNVIEHIEEALSYFNNREIRL